MYPIQIIGIGQGIKDLTQKHLQLIYGCDILVAGRRLLAMFDDDIKAETISITRDIDGLISSLTAKMDRKKIVVLASGDPLFHGIGSSFCNRLEPEKFEIHSNISSISAAFSAIKEPWHDAKIVSLHGTQKRSFSFSSLVHENTVAFLTDPVRTPQYIVKNLSAKKIIDFRFCVAEHLGNPDRQKITWFDHIDSVGKTSFDQPNIVILMRKDKSREKSGTPAAAPHIGMEENHFRHSKGLITKSEVRAVSLAKLKLTRTDHILWDIGAGSGSVSIEAAAMNPQGRVYAFEKNANRIDDIDHNCQKFNISNIKIINKNYPEGIVASGFEELARPDRIFVGGGGSSLKTILEHACKQMRRTGVVVINTVLLQNLETAVATLEKLRYHPEVVQIHVSRGKKMPFGHRFEALNPVWIISGTKK